jgi:WD40 repeat protein
MVARIVCQVLHRSGCISVIWSEGAAFFEPYHLEGSEYDGFLNLAGSIHERLAASAGGAELAQLGHQLYRALFRLDAGAAGAHEIHSWFSALAREGRIDQLEFLGDAPACFPWNVLIEEVPPADSFQPAGEGWQRFFGARFNLGAGRRVNTLRAVPFVEATPLLFAVDPTLASRLDATHQARLEPFRRQGLLLQSAAEVSHHLEHNEPAIVLVLARFEQGRLHMGAESFGSEALFSWLRQARDAGAEPLVILLGTGPAAEQRAWQTFLTEAAELGNGLVAGEALLPAGPLFEFGVNLLERFVLGRESLGEVLRGLRRDCGSAGLTFSTYCPPELRVALEGAAAPEPATAPLPLPEHPYRPFAAYTADERPLFLGRERETAACAEVVDHARTRGILLHGSPAVGKTSFVQAGLLPYLEQQCVGYRVLRDRTPLDTPIAESDYPILILRCTEDLTGQLADALDAFCSQPLTYTTPVGTQVNVDLPHLLAHAISGGGAASTGIRPASAGSAITAAPENMADEPDEENDEESAGLSPRDIWIALRDNQDLLGKLLDDLTRSLPFELVIVVDQGEELLTGPQHQARRQKAIDTFFTPPAVPSRCKWIYALRSQNLGQLLGFLPRQQAPADWRAVYLPMLSPGVMAEALLGPTTRGEIAYSSQIPFEKYGFSFEEGLPAKIVAEANDAAAEGHCPLSLLQAVGALLYDKQVVGQGQDVIHAIDLKAVGPVKDALSKSLDEALSRLPIVKASRAALRDLIARLYTTHPDGTLGREPVPAGNLKSMWKKSPEPVEQVVNTAAENEDLFEIQQLLIGGQQKLYVSLPQDSLAQLGSKIAAQHKEQAYARTRIIDMLWVMIPLVFFAAALSFWATKNYGVNEQAIRDKVEEEIIDKAQKQLDRILTAKEETVRLRIRYASLIAQAQSALDSGDAARAVRALAEAAPGGQNEKMRPVDFRGFDWQYLWHCLHSERQLLKGHRDAVASVAITPDGKYAATGSADCTIRLWELGKGAEIAVLGDTDNPSAVNAVAISPDGKTLATAGADKTVRLWDLSPLAKDKAEIKKEPKSLTGHTGPVHALAFAPDSKTLASGGADKNVILWDLDKAAPRHTLKEHAGTVHALAFTPDGIKLVSGGAEAKLVVWTVADGSKSQAIKTPLQSIFGLGFSRDGKTLAAGGIEVAQGAAAGMIRFYDVNTAAETVPRLAQSAPVFALTFHPLLKDAIAVAGKDGVVREWNLTTRQEQHRWIGHLKAVRGLAFAKDGSALLTGSDDNTAKVWNPAQSSGTEVIEARDKDRPTDAILSLALNRNNTLLASGSSDGAIKFWNPTNDQLLFSLPNAKASVTSLAFSSHPDKTLLAVGTRDKNDVGGIEIWQIVNDSKTGWKATPRPALVGPRKGVAAIAFSPSERHADLLVAAAGNDVTLWDTNKGKEIRTDHSHTDTVLCVAFSESEEVYFSGGKDRQVVVHHIDRQEPLIKLASPAAVESLAVRHAEDNALAILTGGSDNAVRLSLFHEKEYELLGIFDSHSQPVTAVLFTQRGGMFMSSSLDRTIKLFDKYYERLTLTGHTGPVRAIALASDQSFLASAGNDGTIRIWRAAPAERPMPKAE